MNLNTLLKKLHLSRTKLFLFFAVMGPGITVMLADTDAGSIMNDNRFILSFNSWSAKYPTRFPLGVSVGSRSSCIGHCCSQPLPSWLSTGAGTRLRGRLTTLASLACVWLPPACGIWGRSGSSHFRFPRGSSSGSTRR